MKKNTLKTALILTLAPLFLFAFKTKNEKVNFSGNWKLNEAKSELGQFASYATRTIQADQQDEMITIQRTAPSFSGDELTTKEILNFDGKEVESVLFGESKKRSILTWSVDGRTLIITYKLLLDFNGQMNEINGQESWSLAEDGQTLLAENKSSSSYGDMVTKAVYDKQ